MAGSASIVVQSPHVQVSPFRCVLESWAGIDVRFKIVADVQAKLRPLPQYLGPTMTESWLRRYQVRIFES